MRSCLRDQHHFGLSGSSEALLCAKAKRQQQQQSAQSERKSTPRPSYGYELKSLIHCFNIYTLQLFTLYAKIRGRVRKKRGTACA
ncbi:hypothetical protein [Lysinibacillus sp. fls2-241-R2A-57]|uniref:hypothetical protein n=1 Tax=Lysinibacillus sp. fls2-241-R2A-57 TaxID=3040292 RepID=UPI0025550BCB|nr:hypothetical protein [Lysinibacillus sp. fls2-241-R2A-57]